MTERLLGRYREALSTATPGSAVWLSPTSRAAAAIRSRLLGGKLDGCFDPGVTTFARLANKVVERSPQPVRRLSSLMKRQLVGQLIEEELRVGGLVHFGPIASTSGLRDLLCDFIRQMKRLEIWPEQFAEACQQQEGSDKDRELLAVYRAYQQRLVDHSLYDSEGCLWSARDLLHLRPTVYQLIVVDGFSDFTRTEHDILEDLASHGGETWISLPMEEESAGREMATYLAGREDLFQKPQKTLTELRARHANLHVEAVDRPSKPDWPAMAHIERMVFSNPRIVRPADNTAGIEILAGGRQIGEIEMIGRRIKRLLLEGDGELSSAGPSQLGDGRCSQAIRPGLIAVVFRRPQPLAELVDEVFQRLGIPFFLENGRPLSRCPAIVMLLRLLELDADDWPMNRLLAILANNYFAPDWADWNDQIARSAERTIRKLQIPRGRQRLLDALGHLVQAGSPNLAVTFQNLRCLADALDQLPRYDTLAGYALAWTQLAEHVGILRAMQGEADKEAWNKLHETVKESQQLAEWLGHDGPRWDRRQAHQVLLDIIGTQTLDIDDELGRVRVLSASSVRHLQIPYLFVAGLTEKSFPAPDRSEGVYSEAERQRLIEAGLPLPSRGDLQADETLLFYETITSATRRLFLSYPTVAENGEPLTPSPFLAEVEQACGTTPIVRSEQVDLTPVPAASGISSLDGFRIRAVADAVQGKAELLAGLLMHGTDVCPAGTADLSMKNGSVGQCLLRGLAFSRARQQRDRFDAAEGMLSQAVGELLEADFSSHRIFSVTELERYAYCPYQYFLNKVLNVQPPDEVELEVDYMQRGQLAHEVLANFHRRMNESGGGPTSPGALTPADYELLLADAIARTFSQPRDDSLANALLEIDRRILLQWLEDYREQHENYDAQWNGCDRPPRPALFEISFGMPLRAPDNAGAVPENRGHGNDAPSTCEPFEFVSHGQVIRLSGRIDRIDLGEVRSQAIFNVLDYKTGGGTRFSLEACQRGTALQLPLYAMAAAELILNDRNAVPWQAGYWYLSGDGFKPRQALRMYELVEDEIRPSETWEVIRARLADTVAGLVMAMRQGQFPVWSDDPDCTGRCPYKTVCRINQVRSLEKSWRPPAP